MLNQIQRQYALVNLEKVKEAYPWELISKPTIEKNRFFVLPFVDFENIVAAHPYVGANSPRPHNDAQVYFSNTDERWVNATEPSDYPPIYAVSDGYINMPEMGFYNVVDHSNASPPWWHVAYVFTLKIAQSDGDFIDFIYQSFDNTIDNQNNLESKLQLPESYILHIGSFEKRKDLITLVKAFHVIKKQESNNKIKLVLAGAQVVNGNKKIINQIKKYILNNDLENEVILPNYITKEDACQYYKNALIYVFPSVDEGFGIPIIEAFSYSLPIICSDIPVFKEIGNDSVYYFKKKDFISLSKKIQTLINSEDLREELSQKGKIQLIKFSRKKFIKGFEDLIID